MSPFASICVLLCILANAALSQANPTGRIVGGADAAVGQFPFAVSVRRDGSHRCGGSIISNNYMLTAAHCSGEVDENNVFTAFDPTVFKIRIGSVFRASGGSLVDIKNIKIHENYGNRQNDIALFQFKFPLTFSTTVQAIPLATAEVASSEPVVVVGYGRLTQGGEIPTKLQWNTLTAITRAECAAVIPFDSDLFQCLAHSANNGVCNGDSGGAAIYDGKIVGVANYIYGGCGNIYPDIFAKVLPQVQWIIDNTDL